MNNRLNFLLKLYIDQISTEPEETELFELLKATGTEDIEMILEGFLNEQEPVADEGRKDRILNKILHTVQDDSSSTTLAPVNNPSMLRLRSAQAPLRIRWKKLAAAAAVLALITTGGYFIFKNKENHDMVTTEPQEKRFKNDVAAPAKTKATITLADGSTVALDSIAYGKLATQGTVNVMMTADGKVIYKALRQAQGDMEYNTLTNPRGSKVIDMTLADGSHVWLNAGSSVTYPVAFIGNDRKVTMTGEAYFEVNHDATKPFHVKFKDIDVEVLGTHFNINEYDNEAENKTTLLQGSVKVTKGSETVMLKPGQQAWATNKVSTSNIHSDELNVADKVDVEKVMAWKNGFFDCNGLNVESIMREVSRWYDVEVSFNGKVPLDKFVGRIPRTVSLVNLLKVLELNGIRFVIDGKKIEVM